MTKDTKVRSASISLQEWQWQALDSFLPKGDRSDYFQRIVDADLVKDGRGRYFSRLIGDRSIASIETQTGLREDIAELRTTVKALAKGVQFLLEQAGAPPIKPDR